IGSCAGLGIFVMSAHVARHEAGPTVVLSVLVASLAALLAGTCHIELATRLPRSGTGYVFCYVTLGELLAFVIGWSVMFENVLNGAVAAKAIWQYVEYMYNYTADSNSTESTETHEVHIFSSSPDFFSCCLVIAVIFFTFIKVKRYAAVNFILMCFSGLVVLAFICVGFFHVDAKNWNSPPGFFARGFGGIMSGAALLMSTFVNIDNLASCAEETRSPCKSLPTAFHFSLSIVFTILFFVTSALTLASPWQQLTDNAALARAYETKGIFAANYVIGSGAVIGLLPVLIGSFLHPVRVMYSMSGDRLLPKIFSKIAYNGIPMSSIATILQFIISSVILLLIRYQPLPIGICREYSDLDIPSAYEDVLDCKDVGDFNESRPKLVLLANGDHKIHRDDGSVYASIPDTPVSSKTMTAVSMTDAGIKSYNSRASLTSLSNVTLRSHCPSTEDITDGSFKYSSTSTMSFINRFKKLKPPITVNTYSEKDSLRSGAAESATAKEGGYGVLNDEFAGRDVSYKQIADKSQSNLTLNGAKRSIHSSVSSSLVALSPCAMASADNQTWKHTRYFLLVYILSSTCLTATCQAWLSEPLGAWWAVTLLCVSIVLMLVSTLCIARQPQNNTPLYFKAPYVPLVPLLAVCLNMLLLASLPLISWIRFAVWILP
ncbi:unnamed protein product, partial [Candidula unifasciata]